MDFLPLGSVVELKTSEKGQKVMVTARLPLMHHHGKLGYFDYAGVAYPQGQVNEDSYFFNQEDIQHIFFKGWCDNNEEQHYSQSLSESIQSIPYPKFSLSDFD